jgi:hypothetical protein
MPRKKKTLPRLPNYDEEMCSHLRELIPDFTAARRRNDSYGFVRTQCNVIDELRPPGDPPEHVLAACGNDVTAGVALYRKLRFAVSRRVAFVTTSSH